MLLLQSDYPDPADGLLRAISELKTLQNRGVLETPYENPVLPAILHFQ